MSDLSPAAQAVLDAYEQSSDAYFEERGQVAAALRAAAKVIDAIEPEAGEELLAIAAELENQ